MNHGSWRDGADDVPVSSGGGEPARDALLARALASAERGIYGPAPDDTRIASLREKLGVAARPLLARLAVAVPPPRWWEWTARWSRAAIPIGVTAGVAAALLVLASREHTARVLRERTLQGQPPIVRAALSGTRTPELVESVVGPVTGDWLISQVFPVASATMLREDGEQPDSAAPRN